VEESCHFLESTAYRARRFVCSKRCFSLLRGHFLRAVGRKFGAFRRKSEGSSLASTRLATNAPVGSYSAARPANKLWRKALRQVLLYCFGLGKCGTFMPLSGARGESRIAAAWTWFVAVFYSVFDRSTSVSCSQA